MGSLLLVLLLVLLSAPRGASLENGLARTPPLGLSTWATFSQVRPAHLRPLDWRSARCFAGYRCPPAGPARPPRTLT